MPDFPIAHIVSKSRMPHYIREAKKLKSKPYLYDPIYIVGEVAQLPVTPLRAVEEIIQQIALRAYIKTFWKNQKGKLLSQIVHSA